MNTLVRPYEKKDLGSLINVYQSAFAEPPWDEYMKCRKCNQNYAISEVICGERYGNRGEITRFSYPISKECKKCGTDLMARIFRNCGFNSADFVPFWSVQEIENDLNFALAQSSSIILVAESAGVLTGFSWGYQISFEKFPFLSGKISENSSYVDEVAVRGESRRMGIGSLLVAEYMSRAKIQGISTVCLRTDERNVASMGLFRMMGFRSLNVYDQEFEKRIYLTKDIGEAQSGPLLFSETFLNSKELNDSGEKK